MLLVAAMSLGLHRVMEYPDTYRRVSMALLKVPDPFAKFKPPKDMHYDDWYPQSAFSRQELLAKTLAAEVGGYMLELIHWQQRGDVGARSAIRRQRRARRVH